MCSSDLVCGTTVSQFGISRSTTCHGIEVATLRRRIAALEAHIARLEKAGDRMMRGVPAGFHYPSSEEAAWTKAKEAKP